jgi:hypothetical protein
MKHKKTELGRQVFKERNTALSARQRSAFILFDGVKDDAVIFNALAATGFNTEDIDYLMGLGLIELASDTQNDAAAAAKAVTASALSGVMEENLSSLTEQERYQRAYPLATKLTSGLGLRGFRLNMSLESASGYQDLVALAPKIREAVGDEKYLELARALKGL